MARRSQHPDETMESPTPFSLSEAIRSWRAEFGSPSSLSAAELEELEAHLRDHVAQLEAAGMKPEATFAVAARQLGDRQRVATEFAKINPQRVWLERAIWMGLGVVLFTVLCRLAAVPHSAIINYGLTRQWPPAVTLAMGTSIHLGGVVMLVALLWVIVARWSHWGDWLGRFCVQNPISASAAIVLALWGSVRVVNYWPYLLERVLPQVEAWLFPRVHPPFPDRAVLDKVSIICGSAEHVIWAAVLCVLVVRVVRGRRSSLLTANTPVVATNALWLERLMWMVAGYVLVRLGVPFLHDWVMLPARLLLPALGASTLVQHLAGMVTAALGLLLWAAPSWVCWFFATRLSWLGARMRRAFRDRPLWTSVGVTLMLNAESLLWPLLRWAGLHKKLAGLGANRILDTWNYGSGLILCKHVTLAVLLVMLVRWHMKLREAESQRQRAIDL